MNNMNKNINDYLNCIDIIYWINLERSLNRRNEMTKLLSTINLPNQRIDAVDGKNISDENLYKNFNNIQKHRSKVEYACLLSHLNSIKTFYDSSHNIALILEDDISTEYLQYWNKTVCQIISEAPQDWEIIMLNYVSKTTLNDTYTLNKFGHINCCQSYLINKKGAQKLIDSIYKNNIYELDSKKLHTSDNYIYSTLVTYTYKYPYFTYPNNNDSTIHESHLDFHNWTKQNAFVAWKELYNFDSNKKEQFNNLNNSNNLINYNNKSIMNIFFIIVIIILLGYLIKLYHNKIK
jgi:GR25 family glycosyltransferase involved in LPS biosynthesis